MKLCNSLKEVRDEIDKIDDQILDLIGQRSKYVYQAAKFKNSLEEIKSDERVEEVLDHVRHNALVMGISPNMVTKIYRTMIEDMVELEIAEFQNARSL
jgi:isochorismate pyruvate lyase